MDYTYKIVEMSARKESKVYQAIVTAATETFAELGIKNTTMEDIARCSGKGKSTLYYYFPSKEKVFEAVLSQELKKLVQELRIAINRGHTASEKLKILGKVQLTAVLRYRTLERVLQEEIFDSMRGVGDVKEWFETTLFDMVHEIIRGGIQENSVRILDKEEIDKISFITVTIFRGLQLPSYFKDGIDVNSDAYFDTLIDLLFEGIGNK